MIIYLSESLLLGAHIFISSLILSNPLYLYFIICSSKFLSSKKLSDSYQPYELTSFNWRFSKFKEIYWFFNEYAFSISYIFISFEFIRPDDSLKSVLKRNCISAYSWESGSIGDATSSLIKGLKSLSDINRSNIFYFFS